ncbi:putative TPR repeat protein [Magnetospirillum sp. SS-4]|nr:putative TPR repeat protein [Magnetospirillum sp. SS-4]
MADGNWLQSDRMNSGSSTQGQNWQSVVEGLIGAGRVVEAARFMESHLSASPGDVEALRQLARIQLHLGAPHQALARLWAAAELRPDVPSLDYEIGVVHLALGQWDQAAHHLQREIDRQPTHADAFFNLGWALGRAGRSEAAAAALAEAVRLRPDWIQAWYNLGNLLLGALKRPAAAADAYGHVLAGMPNSPEALCNLGLACWELGRDGEAEGHLRAALALKPDMTAAVSTLGNLLTASGRMAEAIGTFQAGLALCPDDVSLALNLGVALGSDGRASEAVDILTAATRAHPSCADLWNALGRALLSLERVEVARSAFETALRLKPDFAHACNNLGNLDSSLRREREALEHYRRAHAMAPTDSRIQSNLLFFLTNMGIVDKAEVVAEHRRFGEIQEAAVPVDAALLPVRPADGRLRIGYVSPDFCDHAVTFWFEAILEHHDATAFELFCYACGPRADAVTDRLKGYVPHWRQIGHLSWDVAADVIRRDGIHILVDLAGHSAWNALPVFVRKPAPIQATMIGYPFTTGLTRIDYRVTDIHTDPPGLTDDDYTETLVRLDYAPTFRLPRHAPDPGPLPALSGGGIRFGSFNKPQKITEEVVAAWARVLNAVPDSSLLLVLPGGDTPSVQDMAGSWFLGHGVEKRRIETVGTCQLDQFLDLVRRVDIALDPFPYGGGTTTVLTLWMGVPVVALRGSGPASGVSTGMLGAAERLDLATETVERYVEMAVGLTTDLKALSQLRAALRPRIARSVISQEMGYVRSLEAAFYDWGRLIPYERNGAECAESVD